MIEITDGFTSITAGANDLALPAWSGVGDSRTLCRRAPTGARVTLEFSRALALPPNEPVRVRYEFGGTLRETVGIAQSTHVEVRRGRAVVYHYRLSHWIAPAALMSMPPAMCGHAWQPLPCEALLRDGLRATVWTLEAI